MKRQILSISLLLAMSASIYAVPARRGIWRDIPTVAGTVRAELAGDEYFSYYVSESGGCFTLNAATGIYELADVGAMQQAASARRAMANKSRMNRAARNRSAATRATGKKKGLVVLVEFSDVRFAEGNTRALYNDILNKDNFTDSSRGFIGSVSDYFRDQSNGKLDIDFDVLGPITMPRDYAYYGANTGVGGNDAHVDEIMTYVCDQIDDNVNFADYDWDGDGEVDQICMLYAGQGENAGGDANTIWPHESDLSRYGHNVVKDGVKVNTYACSSELGLSGKIDGIGTFCHEFSHCLGIPDFYDTAASVWTGGQKYGMYKWDIMSYGNYNGDGFVPAAYTSYERWLAGWDEPIELNEDTSVSGMKGVSEGGKAYIIYNEGNRNEYYLLENRRKTGWDSEQPGEGLLVIHVDYDKKLWDENMVNSTNGHQHFTPIAADNSYEMTDEDCAGDLFPYAGNNSLTDATTPAATLYNKNSDGSYNMNKWVTDITRNADGTISFSFKIADTTHQPDKDGNWFYESFNNCAGAGGNDGKWGNAVTGGYPNDFNPDNSGWECTNANYLRPGNQCAKIEGGTLKSPLFYFADGSTITFKAAPCKDYETALTLGTDAGTLGQTAFTMKEGEWTEFTTTLSGNGFTQISFTTDSRFFIDEVKVMSSAAGITDIKNNANNAVRIYGIDGRYMGNDLNALGKGLYIVNGKKIIK